MGEDKLSEALAEGDPEKVRALVRGGANLRYKREEGYDALVDAVHGRDVARDPRLLELLELLIENGVDLSGVTSYGESGLRVLSRLGRFDGVRLLLAAGAERGHLEWTPLMEAVALGSPADVRKLLDQNPPLEERDWWSRSAWLIALLTGDLAKAELLRDRGADTHARGRCGRPPLFYPIQGHHPPMLRWLILQGQDIEQADDFGGTPLIEAVEEEDLECVEILLSAGALVDVDANGTALRRAESREIILRLLDAGADPGNLTYNGHRAVLRFPLVDEESAAREEAFASVSPEAFRRHYTRVFGKRNPERMDVPFWEVMIRSGVPAYDARTRFETTTYALNEPVWCANRFGQSLTLLPDGRVVQIGGEHEDFYDPDFCIYNDVFVHDPDGKVTVYGYPETVFPPTDFHTTTLIGNWIYVIGSLGYHGHRHFGAIPVYRLDVKTFAMERLDTRGDGPGWIYKHQAAVAGADQIRVWGGLVAVLEGGGEAHRENHESFALDLRRNMWIRDG